MSAREVIDFLDRNEQVLQDYERFRKDPSPRAVGNIHTWTQRCARSGGVSDRRAHVLGNRLLGAKKTGDLSPALFFQLAAELWGTTLRDGFLD